MQWEGSFHTNAVGYPPDGEGFAKAATPTPNHCAFKHLDSFPAAFYNPNVYADCIPHVKWRDILLNLFLFHHIYQIHLNYYSFPDLRTDQLINLPNCVPTRASCSHDYITQQVPL
jgi:hypothetical protein